MDWAEKRAREIVAIYRPLFKDDAAANADGLVNVIAGELRGVENTARRQAVTAGENLVAALQRLTCA